MTAPNDTKPALQPAARLAEIRERDKRFGDGEIEQAQDIAEDRAELLAHLDALTAPCDRETGGRLVREVWIAWAKEQPTPKASWLVPWEGLSEPDKEVDRRIFEACVARGFAAGADLASETTRHLIEARDLAQRTAEIAHAEIARLTAELAATKEDRR